MVKHMFKDLIKTLGYLTVIISYIIINYLSSAYLYSKTPLVAIIIEFIYIISLFFILRYLLIKDFKNFIKNIDQNLSLILRYWMIGVLLMSISNLVIEWLLPNIETANEDAVRSLIDISPIIMFITVSLFAPIIEEIVFRGIFRKIFKTNWLFLLMSTLMFSAMHVVSSFYVWSDLTLIIPYAFIGGAMSWSYLKSNNIFIPMTIHLLHNSISFALYIFLQ